jgi:DNA-binding GntR family transcriptional regulator
VNGEVLANQTNVIPFEVCPGLENDDVSRASFQQLIDGKYHAVTVEMKEEFAIIPATAQDQQILGLADDDQILDIQRTALSATDQPLIWTDIHVRPDRFDYVAALWPSAKRMLEEYQLKHRR